jgi:hypothetical protein
MCFVGRKDTNEGQLRLSVWVSLLKQRTTSEKEKAEGRGEAKSVSM